MKKIYYLLAFAAVGFTACQKQPIVGLGGSASSEVKALNLTLAAADYASLGKSVYPYSTKSFNSDADAKLYIPTILNTEYPHLSNGSTANITFTEQPLQADSVFKDLTYTLVTTPVNDYTLLPGNKFSDFSIAQTLAWLPFKFPTPVPNQQEILTFAYYNGSVTATSTFSFLFLNNAWVQAYLITPAQYTSIGRGTFNQFTSADDANIVGYLNGFLKTDPNIIVTAKAGSVQYVSFNYYSSGKITSQRIFTMIYNGTNWVNNATNTLAFIKTGGTWIPDPTVYYTLKTADTQLIGNPNGTNNQTIGTTAQRANLYQYGDFSGWAIADLNNAMILVLTTDFPNPTPNINYKVTFLLYTGVDTPTTYTFSYVGGTWIAAQP